VFFGVGGLDQENLKISFNDIDLCLKVEEFGYANLCTPFEPLFHLEGATRSSEVSPDRQAQDRRELLYLYNRWMDRFDDDCASHPNIEWSWDKSFSLIESIVDNKQ